MDFRLQGIIVPIVTPFTADGELDTGAVKPLVDYLIARGVSGLFPGGTTGEGFLLSFAERKKLAEAVVDAAAGRARVVVHAGTTTTADTLDLTLHAHAVGADAVAIIPPFVYHHSDAALLQHYKSVAQCVPEFPIYLYNFPAISNNALSADLILSLMNEAPNVLGMKDSSGSLEVLAQVVAATDGRFNAINGGDGQALMALAMGFDGCVSGNANVVPELMVSLYESVAAGDLAQARVQQQRLNRVRDLLGDGGNLALFKGMLARRGVMVGGVRAPQMPTTDELVEARWGALTELGVVK